MRKSIFKLAAVSVAMSALAVSAPAFAQDAAEEEASGPITITGGIAAVSDYRFRGVSLTGKDFAIQPYLTVKHESGFYAGVWGSNLSANAGDDVEVDLYAGFSGGDAVTYDIGATYYVYPGVSSFNYVEFTGKLGTTVGPATIGGQVSYVPSQDNTGNSDNLYVATNAAVGIPGTPLPSQVRSALKTVLFQQAAARLIGRLDWPLRRRASPSGWLMSTQTANRLLLSRIALLAWCLR